MAAPLRALKDDFSLRRDNASRETSHEAGLPGSGRPYDRNELPSWHLDIHPAKKPAVLPFQSQFAKGYLFGPVSHSLPRLASAIESFNEPRWEAASTSTSREVNTRSRSSGFPSSIAISAARNAALSASEICERIAMTCVGTGPCSASRRSLWRCSAVKCLSLSRT